MLEKQFRFDDNKEHEYNLVLRRDPDWSSAPRKLLIILQTIDGRDLKERRLFSNAATESVVKNTIKYARQLAKPYAEKDGKVLPTYSYCVVNYNQKKHLHLKKEAKRNAESEFTKRMHTLIKTLEPTHIMVAGHDAFKNLFPQVENSNYKNGWIHKLHYKKGGEKVPVKVCQSLDLYKLLDRSSEHANLLGFYCRHLAYLMLGKNPHDLSKMEVEPIYVKTMDQFYKVMKRWDDSKEIAVDTETKNLSVLHNKLLTIQFAFDTAPTKGYVLAVDHPLAHWTSAERKEIKAVLKEKFSDQKDEKLLLMFNGMFDLRIIRRALKIPVIWHKVWEITAGEHLLDENIGLLSSFLKGKHGGLASILCSYGNDTYYTAEFRKEDRDTIISIKPNKPGPMKYMATDVVSLLGIKKQQIRRASMLDLEGENYKPYFIRHMLYQMSDTAHQLSHLREDGSHVSMRYLNYLLSEDSPLKTELNSILQEFKQYPEVKEANAKLVGDSGFKAKGLAALASMKGAIKKNVGGWTFKLTKPAHKKLLFVDTLGLEPLETTKTGEPQIDKAYIKHYKDKNKIVQAYAQYQVIEKLMSTYVRGWWKKLTRNQDSATDFHLRPDYSFWDVVTGRLASKNPSLQTIPQRSKVAKYIKRMFETEKGYLLLRYDYSAHEVRVWAIIARDTILAAAFKAGQALRRKLIAARTPEELADIRAELKQKGDIHIQNVFRFFRKWVDKSHPLRDAIKAVVFGVLYGKSAETLGEDTKLSDINGLKDKISQLYSTILKIQAGETVKNEEGKPLKLEKVQKELESTEKKLDALMKEDRTEYAQGIIDKMFSEFKAGAKWTRKMTKLAEEKFYVYAPNGRRRFLPAAMVNDRQIINQQVRRGTNGPVQGMASEIGVKASRVFMEAYYRHAPKIAKMLGLNVSLWWLKVFYARVVHDANYMAVRYVMMIPAIHIMQWGATTGVSKAYKEQFNIPFVVDPEIEMEVAARDDQSYKWDWTISNLIDNLEKSVKDAKELGRLEGDVDEVMDEILEPWRNLKIRHYLQKHFPILDVQDLDYQIDEALAAFDAKRKEARKAAKKEAEKAINKAKAKKKEKV